jgi:NADH-quinone oxidoreductase subunit N
VPIDPAVQQTLTGVFRLVTPEIALVGVACVAFLGGAFVARRGVWAAVTLVGLLFALALHFNVAPAGRTDPTLSPIYFDGLSAFVRLLALGSAAVYLLLSWSEVPDRVSGEYYGCLLVVTAGVSLVGSANDLITLFLALELVSIPTYVLLYLPYSTKLSQEAAVKYFLLSVLSSGFLLFGFSYFYGLTGTTNLTALVLMLTEANVAPSPLALIAAVMVIAAIGFRITAVPFHFYAPDVYEGAPTGVAAQLAFLPKVAGFVALIRILGLVGGSADYVAFPVGTQIPLLLWILAVVTMSFGNVLALLQDNLKRLMAYSGVAHAGYMLIGVVVGSYVSAAPDSDTRFVAGVDSLLFYLVAYGAMTVGVFAVIQYLSTPERPIDSADDLAGLHQTHPFVAFLMAIFLFSLIGLPLTAGFAGKFLVFMGALEIPTTSGVQRLYQWLAVLAAVNAAIGAYYYLRVVGIMYLRSPLKPAAAGT